MSDKNTLSSRILSVRVSLAVAVAILFALGATSVQAAESTNRLAANRLAANRLAANRLAANRLSENRLEANPETAEMLNTADGREVFSYIMSCALAKGTRIEATVPGAPDTAPPDTLYRCKNERCRFPGSLGLTEHWIDRRLSPKGQRWITACLLARVNLYGIKQIISMRGAAPELSVSPEEAELYSLQEGAFYGNIFVDPAAPLDWNACRGRDQAAGEEGGLELRDCTEPDPNDPSHTKCGFKYAGDCGNYTGSSAHVPACWSLDPKDGAYSDCLVPEADGQEPSRIHHEVITTYVRHR
jgi:hypothetical protein